MLLDAIVLAGGRSSRLGGEPKPHLVVDGRSLLRCTLDAARAAGARRVVVVGEPALAADCAGAGAAVEADTGAGAETGAGTETGTGAGAGTDRALRIEVVREEPPFGGPAAAIAAGMAALGASLPDAVPRRILVLACDMPGCGVAVSALIRAVEAAADAPGPGGFVAVDASGRRQHLLAVYDAAALGAAVQRVGARLDGLAVRTLVEPLELCEVVVSVGASDDVDTWIDAERLGAKRPSSREAAPEQRSSDEF